jgi:thiol peroxidase
MEGENGARQERSGVVTMLGAPMILIGADLGPGDRVREFTLIGPDLAPVGWSDLRGKPTLFNVVFSVDTEICGMQTRRFNDELAALPESVAVVTVSADLPFAQARFAKAEKIRHRILSDYRDFSFARAFGIGIKDVRLLARSIFVIDAGGSVTYREIVPELTHHPSYSRALEAIRGLV